MDNNQLKQIGSLHNPSPSHYKTISQQLPAMNSKLFSQSANNLNPLNQAFLNQSTYNTPSVRVVSNGFSNNQESTTSQNQIQQYEQTSFSNYQQIQRLPKFATPFDSAQTPSTNTASKSADTTPNINTDLGFHAASLAAATSIRNKNRDTVEGFDYNNIPPVGMPLPPLIQQQAYQNMYLHQQQLSNPNSTTTTLGKHQIIQKDINLMLNNHYVSSNQQQHIHHLVQDQATPPLFNLPRSLQQKAGDEYEEDDDVSNESVAERKIVKIDRRLCKNRCSIDKTQKRRLQNRKSALKCRLRKSHLIANLNVEVTRLKTQHYIQCQEIVQLKDRLNEEQLKNSTLIVELTNLKATTTESNNQKPIQSLQNPHLSTTSLNTCVPHPLIGAPIIIQNHQQQLMHQNIGTAHGDNRTYGLVNSTRLVGHGIGTVKTSQQQQAFNQQSQQKGVFIANTPTLNNINSSTSFTCSQNTTIPQRNQLQFMTAASSTDMLNSNFINSGTIQSQCQIHNNNIVSLPAGQQSEHHLPQIQLLQQANNRFGSIDQRIGTTSKMFSIQNLNRPQSNQLYMNQHFVTDTPQMRPN